MDGTYRSYSKAQALRSGDKAPVRQALVDVRRSTLQLAEAYESALAPAGMQVAYATGVNPPLWEWGHTAWFQEFWIGRNLQRSLGVQCDPLHARASSLLQHSDEWFDSSRVEHSSRWRLSLPGVGATREYLAATLQQTLALLDALPAGAGAADLYFFRLVALHEAMHAEAATYMAKALGIAIPAASGAGGAQAQTPAVCRIPAQAAFQLGASGDGFAFDNELGPHPVRLGAFEIDAQPVRWDRFLAFAEAGGYRQKRWWTDAGWSWLQRQHQREEKLPVPGDTGLSAMHLTAHEAQAWCRWAGRRLPTEAEWECAAISDADFEWGSVWEWTASAFQPYPGFTPHPYRDYSQPWFGTRRVLRGACQATSPWLAHPRYRNFFEPHRDDVFAGFRSCA